jgi:hypothetical protein
MFEALFYFPHLSHRMFPKDHEEGQLEAFNLTNESLNLKTQTELFSFDEFLNE